MSNVSCDKEYLRVRKDTKNTEFFAYYFWIHPPVPVSPGPKKKEYNSDSSKKNFQVQLK